MYTNCVSIAVIRLSMVGFTLRGRGWLPMRIPLGTRVVPTEVAVPVVTDVSSSARGRAGGLSDVELDLFLDLGEELRPVLTCSATMTACHCGFSSETAEVGLARVSDSIAATGGGSVFENERVACD